MFLSPSYSPVMEGRGEGVFFCSCLVAKLEFLFCVMCEFADACMCVCCRDPSVFGSVWATVSLPVPPRYTICALLPGGRPQLHAHRVSIWKLIWQWIWQEVLARIMQTVRMFDVSKNVHLSRVTCFQGIIQWMVYELSRKFYDCLCVCVGVWVRKTARERESIMSIIRWRSTYATQ